MIKDFIALSIRILTGVNLITDHATEGPARIYYANHSSHLDFIVIWAALPKPLRQRVRPVAASDYWESGFIRRYLAKHIFHALLIPRGKVSRNDNPIGNMTDAMDLGSDLIIFPEGTRSTDGHIAEFKNGIHALAKHYPEATLIPVHLKNLNRILPKGECFVVPLIASAIFGPNCPALIEGESRAEFLHRIRQSLLALDPHSAPLSL